MSMNQCALSGEVLAHPVISKNTGHIFEKELILKHVEKTGQCPITGRELKKEDLLDVNKDNLATKPRESVESMSRVMNLLQTESDSLILDNFLMKKQLKEVKHELTHSLYQHESASMVICRLIKERDEAVKQLNMFKSKMETLKQEIEDEEEEEKEFEFMGVYEELTGRMNELSSSLTKQRKKRAVPKNLKTSEEIKQFKLKNAYPLHSSSKPGITCVNVHPVEDRYILTGGVDAKAVVFDTKEEKSVFTNDRPHTKRINSAKFYPAGDILAFALGSQDGLGSFWVHDKSLEDLGKIDSNFHQGLKERYRVATHSAAITGVSFHPLKEYCLFSSRDMHWSFHSMFKGVCLTKQKTESESEISKCEFHPDGLLFGCGEKQGLVKLWDITSQNPVATFEGHKTEVSDLSFSENGYHLVSGALKDNTIKLWDLRKPQAFKTLTLPDHFQVKALKFDESGSYLAVAGSTLRVYNTKTFSLSAEFNHNSDVLTGVDFGSACKYLASSSMDRTMKIFN